MMVDSVEMTAAINSLQVLSTEGTNDRAYRDLLLMVRKMYINGVVSTEDKEWFESIGITTVSVIMPDFSTHGQCYGGICLAGSCGTDGEYHIICAVCPD